jgi:hypothetical protein
MNEDVNKAEGAPSPNGSWQKDGKNCKMCGYGYGRGHFGFRILLAIIVLLVVFWLGTVAGRLHSGYGRGSYGGSMRHPSPMMRAYPASGYPSGMMQGAPGRMLPQTATTTPAK